MNTAAKSKTRKKKSETKGPQIELTDNWILVTVDSAKVLELTLSKGGKIISPAGSKATKYLTGVVVAAGPGILNAYMAGGADKLQPVPLNANVGDRVLFHYNHHSPIYLRGDEYSLLRDTNVIGIL